MHKLAILFLIFLTPATVMAEARVFRCETGKGELSQKAGQKIVTQVQARYSKISSLAANFHQDSFLAAVQVAEASTGQLWYAKPGKMKWVYAAPEEQTLIVNDNTYWLYQKTDNQVLIDNFQDVVISELPVGFLLGVGDLARDFSLVEACKTSDGTLLVLEPREKSESSATQQGEHSHQQGLKAFKLLVNKEDLPLGAQVTDVAGNVTAVFLENLKVDAAVAGTMFQPTTPTGADIIDRRKERT